MDAAAAPKLAALGCLQALLELQRPEAQELPAAAAAAEAAAAAGQDSAAAATAAADAAAAAAAQLSGLARELQSQYVRNKTLTPTTQGEVLQTLGLLLELGGEVSAASCFQLMVVSRHWADVFALYEDCKAFATCSWPYLLTRRCRHPSECCAP